MYGMVPRVFDVFEQIHFLAQTSPIFLFRTVAVAMYYVLYVPYPNTTNNLVAMPLSPAKHCIMDIIIFVIPFYHLYTRDGTNCTYNISSHRGLLTSCIDRVRSAPISHFIRRYHEWQSLFSSCLEQHLIRQSKAKK